jgi:hypothetical protein
MGHLDLGGYVTLGHAATLTGLDQIQDQPHHGIILGDVVDVHHVTS